MIIHDCIQLSNEWAKLHMGIPTASALDNLLTPEFKARTGDMPKTYLHRKLAEVWRGQPSFDSGFSSFSTEQGLLLEQQARAWLAFETDIKVRQVGFITTDDGRCGCSPDGLLSEDSGLELKSPDAHTHVKYLLQGTLPKEYAAQVHGSMYVTGFQRWTFMSYRRKFPPFILVVQRDEEIISKIEQAVTLFHADLTKGKARIAEYQEAA